MSAFNNLLRLVTRSPILWGLLGTAAFYGLVHGGPLNTPFVNRYFTHHPVEYGETVMFAIGLAALVLRMIDVAAQRTMLGKSPLGAVSANRPLEEQCRVFREQCQRQPAARQADYYLGRLRAAVRYIERLGSTEGLGDELKYLADMDAGRAHTRYALFRVIVWAIPILGFLGTVIGITLALNGIDPKAPDESMLRVITGLGLKFDTTAVALSLSMVLMFVHFFVDGAENALIAAVDERVENDLAERFPMTAAGPDGQVVAMRRMAEVMVQASDRLIERQTELWRASMDAAAARWDGLADAAGEQLTRAMTAALGASLKQHVEQLAAVEREAGDRSRQEWQKLTQVQAQNVLAINEGLKSHALQIAAAEQAAAEQNCGHWDKMTQTHTQYVQALAALQHGLVGQAEVLNRVLQATADVGQLQDALNRNLNALAGSKNFEQTVLGLAGAIHLLNARLIDAPDGGAATHVESTRRTAKAA